ncbi:MAG: phosphotransferase, partial [Muribaculaceae bacterium]|nr:phosphotransferase [Muribaculaceae bacterium]
EIKEIKKLYKELTGADPGRVQKLPGAGSSRCYFRLFPSSDIPGVPSDARYKRPVIATMGKNSAENEVFCRLSDFFRRRGIRVPAVLASADGCYLQTDHGDSALYDLILKWQKDPDAFITPLKRNIRAAIDELVKIQTVDESVFDGPMMAGSFSIRQVMWDLNYFKYNFMRPSGIEPDEERLEDDFERMAGHLGNSVSEALTGFMYRDFQSRNILLEDSGVTLIDFQGGRRGPLVYDIISLLWQAKARFPEHLRAEMLDYYIDGIAAVRGQEVRDEIRRLLPDFILFRTLQVLGAYGFRGIVERKAHFIESIAGGLENLEALLDSGTVARYPELERCCRILVAGKGKYGTGHRGNLRVEVFSFSYKKGYPDDWTGNGGGFMFDCRGMHNPGRYEEYKQLTGCDRPVIEFLEQRGEVQRFLEAALMLTVPAIESYFRRGFTNLQIGFGCTGGQHRSVYCAGHLAETLAARFPEVEIILTHREQGIRKVF